jgi:hypothetical protein
MDASLNINDCEWTSNTGASAILIHNDENLDTTSDVESLDITPMLDSTRIAMSVEVTGCRFGNNTLTFGAVTNIGGTLSIDKSKFAENSGKGGDIVVTNQGSVIVKESCFEASSSISPGVIFVESGSNMNGNQNNFGFGITSGGYSSPLACNAIFIEAEGSNCLSSSTCDGACAQFAATACIVDNPLVAVAAPSASNQIYVPAYTREEDTGSSKIVPLVVAVIIAAFIVFGLVAIICRRRKVSNASNANEQDEQSKSGGVICCCWKRGGNEKSIERRRSSFNDDEDDELVDAAIKRRRSSAGGSYDRRRSSAESYRRSSAGSFDDF